MRRSPGRIWAFCATAEGWASWRLRVFEFEGARSLGGEGNGRAVGVSWEGSPCPAFLETTSETDEGIQYRAILQQPAGPIKARASMCTRRT